MSLYSRYVNRPCGRLIAAAAHALGLSPNAVTCLSAAFTALAVLALATLQPTPVLGLVISALLVTGFAFDSADGQVARLSGRSSPAGEWLDHVVDSAKMVAVHGGVLIGWYRFADFDDPWLLAPLAFQLVAVVTFSALTITTLLKRAQPRPGRGAGRHSAARAVLLLPADYGILAISLVLWGAPDLFRVVYVVLLVANAAILVALLAKWYHELVALND